MPLDLTGIGNENQFFSDHYLAAIFEGDLKPLFDKWKEEEERGAPPPHEKLKGLARSFLRMRREQADASDAVERLALRREWYARFLEALGYVPGLALRHTIDGVSIPVSATVDRPDGAPELWILEAVNSGCDPADPLELTLIPEQYPSTIEAQTSLDDSWEEIITKYVFGADEPPRWALLCGVDQVLLLDRAKWARKRVLRFDLGEIFSRAEASTFRATAALLHRESLCPPDRVSLLDTLDENSHRHAFSVSDDLKYSAREAVELLGNEAVWYLREVLHEKIYGTDLADQLTGECLRYLYRLLFLFYVEAREELGYAPLKSDEYREGYSLESLRSLAEIHLTTDEARDSFFINDSLRILFRLLFQGFRHELPPGGSDERTFRMDPLRADLFDPAGTPLLNRVKMRSRVLQRVLELLSLSRPQRGRRRGRISYAQLGINQLGSVYEGLLSYTGFFAEDDLYEVKKAGDAYDPLSQAFFVPAAALPAYTDEEKCLDDEGRLLRHPKGSFIYRLAGRSRQKSASYYTPESLTRCVVKYALKELLKDKTADDILNLTLCEPALGSGAFQNEAINQLAEIYLERKQKETGRSIRHEDYGVEKQKVKAFLADNRVFGVDKNPTAIQLAEISLWLNTIYRGHTIPWFGGQLTAGNSLIGARRQAFTKAQLEDQRRLWLEAVPEKVPMAAERGADRIWHFLVPDDGMADYDDRDVRSLVPEEHRTIKTWKREFLKRFDGRDTRALLRLSSAVDRLWARHTDDLRRVRKDTAHIFPVFGQEDNPDYAETGNRLTTSQRLEIFERQILGRGSPTATPYRRLKLAMDYWCALWFWPINQAHLLPTRDEYLLELQAVLEGTSHEEGRPLLGAEQPVLFDQAKPKQEQLRLAEELGSVDLDDLFERHPRLALVNKLAERHRFLHWELEYADLFRDRGGFDLILGNPPWIKIEWNEGGVMGDVEPRYVLRNYAAPELARLRAETMAAHPGLRETFLDEYVELTGTQNFLNARQNYPLLRGSQSNTYKCFLTRSWEIASEAGVQGFLHPEGVYDDPNGGVLRRELYQRLRHHFQFQNVLKLFPEILHWVKFSVNTYGTRRSVSFESISNLFHPKTVGECFDHDGGGVCDGIKDEQNAWNLRGHRKRIIEIDESVLGIFSLLFDEAGTPPAEARIPCLHSLDLLAVLSKVARYSLHLGDIGDEYVTTRMWEERAVLDGVIYEKTTFPDQIVELLLSGPHIGVANPYDKTPRRVFRNKSDYDVLDLTEMPATYLPRTNFLPNLTSTNYSSRIKKVSVAGNRPITDFFRLIARRKLSQTGERTLIAALYPPGIGHVDTCFSVYLSDLECLLALSVMAASLPADFFVKSTGKADFREDLVRSLPLLRSSVNDGMRVRILLLNCVTADYSPLWSSCFKMQFLESRWSKNDPRLGANHFLRLLPEWSWQTPLRYNFERRQALLEIDVLVAQALGLTLEELLTIYRIQFPVFRQYERNTFYDRNGRIVYLAGDSMYGFRTPEWKTIKDMKEGTVNRTLQDDTLPGGPREKVITYQAPFDCPDREADYARAWEFFE